MYKRVVVKISGEALSGDTGFGLSDKMLDFVAFQIKELANLGVQIGIIVGGGNFWRGRQADSSMDRTTADHMGMLATVINALALQEALERNGVQTRVQSALNIASVAEPFIQRRAIRHLEKGRVVIFACGTGNPYFTTDTGAAIRAAEIDAEVLLLAKNIDGIYSADPKVDKNAVKYDQISYMDVISKDLKATDATSITICRDNNIPIIAFGLDEKDSIIKAAKGESTGTIIN